MEGVDDGIGKYFMPENEATKKYPEYHSEHGFGVLKVGTISVPNDNNTNEVYLISKSIFQFWEQKWLLVKKGDAIPQNLLDLIKTVDTKVNPDSVFYITLAEEMLICYAEGVTDKEVRFRGKIEFSQKGAYINWICAPGNGEYCFNIFERRVLRERQINSTQFIIRLTPSESNDTLLRRINFYVRKIPNLRFINIGFEKELGGLWFRCEIKL
jgi:hypothetical protein